MGYLSYFLGQPTYLSQGNCNNRGFLLISSRASSGIKVFLFLLILYLKYDSIFWLAFSLACSKLLARARVNLIGPQRIRWLFPTLLRPLGSYGFPSLCRKRLLPLPPLLIGLFHQFQLKLPHLMLPVGVLEWCPLPLPPFNHDLLSRTSQGVRANQDQVEVPKVSLWVPKSSRSVSGFQGMDAKGLHCFFQHKGLPRSWEWSY